VALVFLSSCTVSPGQRLTPQEQRVLFDAQEINFQHIADNARATTEWNRIQA